MPANNSFDDINRLIDDLSRSLVAGIDKNNESFLKAQQTFIDNLRSASTETVNKLKDTYNNIDNVYANAIEEESNKRKKATERIIELLNKEAENKTAQINIAETLQNTENSIEKQRLTQKQQILTEESTINNLLIQKEQAIVDGNVKLVAEIEESIEKYKKQRELEAQLKEEEIEQHKKIINKFTEVLSSALGQLESTYTNAISSVTSVYNQQAGKLSAMLNESVNDVSKLQKDIATALKDSSLSKAISNVTVLNEATNLVSSGYTDTTTLQQNATDIAIGKEIAPSVDFNNSTVKNLINIFGSDFTHKFSAILQAAQETAGSAVNISNNLSDLITNLEPVYTNAQYQQNALQGTADVTATLANAREQGIITQTQEAEYKNMLIELMDPSKAFKSNNVAVKVAATQYDFNGNPADALAALISARQQYYGNFDQSNTYTGRVSRSLGASVAGDSTLDATYNQAGLTGLQLISAEDLDATYNEQIEKLKNGDYTTASESIKNSAENSSLVQSLSSFSKTFPRTYQIVQGQILAAINLLPSKLNGTLSDISKRRIEAAYTGNGDIIDDDISRTSGSGSIATIGNNGSLQTKLNNLNYKTFSGKATKISNAVGGRTGGLAMASYGAGISGAMSIASSLNEEGMDIQGFGMGGDKLSAALSYGGVGAAVGSLIAPGLGTAVGSLAGAILGFSLALAAENDSRNEQTEALEEMNEQTKSILGEGITKLSDAEAKAAVASGGGTISLNSGIYELDIPKAASGLDYVPYDDYLVKLHKGEAVVTAQAAQNLRKSDPNFWNNSNSNNINNDVIFALEKSTDSIVKAVKGDTDILPMTKQGPKQYNITNNYA